jgi:hypothetical protein
MDFLRNHHLSSEKNQRKGKKGEIESGRKEQKRVDDPISGCYWRGGRVGIGMGGSPEI